MKLDPGIHIVMHSVLSLKLGVTVVYDYACASSHVVPFILLVISLMHNHDIMLMHTLIHALERPKQRRARRFH